MSFKYTYEKPVLTDKIMELVEAGSLDGKIEYINSSETSTDVYAVSELSLEDRDTLDTIILDHSKPLCIAKISKIEEVKNKTQAEEGMGVPYNNYRFAANPSAKSNWLAIVIAKDSLTYPFSAPTGFGSIYNFQSANDILGFFMASMSFLKYWEESDEQLVIAINACTTIGEVEAIVDDREYPVV